MATEFIAGKEFAAIKTISEKIIKALIHIHSKGYIHGDMKPLVSISISIYSIRCMK
jgi:serine/threonine protein kinase